jgi:integrase/recombinase XerD
MNTPPTNAGRTFVPEPLTVDEVRKLLAAIPTRSSSGKRLRAMVAVMYGSGLRVSELLALMPKDIDHCTVRVRNGKGGKTRVVGLDESCCEVLGRWTDARAALGLTGRHPLFATYEVGKVGRPVSDRYVRLALVRAGERAGLTKRVHPHGLRHSLAFQMAQSGQPMHVIQAQLGHSSLAVTDRYIRHLNPVEVVDAVRAMRLLDA